MEKYPDSKHPQVFLLSNLIEKIFLESYLSN